MRADKTELIIGLIVLVFSMFPTQIFDLAVAQWITLICGLLLILHSFAEKNMGFYTKRNKLEISRTPVKSTKSSKSKKRRR